MSSRRQYDDYGRGSSGRDRPDTRDERSVRPRVEARDDRRPQPRDARDLHRETRERDPRERDPYASRRADDMDMDVEPPARGSGRMEQVQPRGAIDPRSMDPRYDARPLDSRGLDDRMDMRGIEPRLDRRDPGLGPQEPVMYREYRNPRTGELVREQVPGPQYADDGLDRSRRRPANDPYDYDTPMDEPPRGGASSRFNDYFLPGDGINREVIQYEICRYLGQDATVRPSTRDGRSGFTIRAYRALTTAMIASLKQDSARFEQEQRAGKHGRGGGSVAYASSNALNVRDQTERSGPRGGQSGYRGTQMDVDDFDMDRDPVTSPGGYGREYDSRALPPSSRHQVPVTSAGYLPESSYPGASYALAGVATTQGSGYYDSNDSRREPRTFSNTTPDPSGRQVQVPYSASAGYPANTQATRQPSAAVYIDPRTGQTVQAYPPSSGYATETTSRHARR